MDICPHDKDYPDDQEIYVFVVGGCQVELAHFQCVSDDASIAVWTPRNMSPDTF